jgi:hypothetical protein
LELFSNEIITVLSYLLPGFITAWIYYGLTAFSKPSQFERIVQALIYTVAIQVLVISVRWFFLIMNTNLLFIGTWTKNSTLICSFLLAIFLGLFVARYSNNDKIHNLLRKLSFTKQTSYPSEWYGTFSQNKTYVVLHLKDQRRIYGWPEEWPNEPEVGYFSISEAEWLEDSKRIPLQDVSNILIPASEVLFVEFMVFNNNDKSNLAKE